MEPVLGAGLRSAPSCRTVERQKVRIFGRNQSGAVATTFAIFCTALFILAGLATDIGRWVAVRNETLSAMDSAILAGGRALQLGAERHRAIEIAAAFYRQNVSDRTDVLRDTVTFDVAENGLAFAALGNVTLATPFLSLVNFRSLDVLQRRDLEQSKVRVGVGRFARQNLEIALMMDVSAGMSGEKLANLKQLASDFVTLVVWEDQSTFRSRVSLVPVSSAVRPPEVILETVRGARPALLSGPSPNGFGSAYYRLTDCAAERTGGGAFSDDAPEGAQTKLAAVYTTVGLCSMAEGSEVMALSSDRQRILDKIHNLEAAGALAGHLGVAWSWYTLSPNWNDVWPSESEAAAAYGGTEVRKIAVLMAGDEFNTQYDAIGLSANPADVVNGSSHNQTANLCRNMKRAGIEIFTIGYDLPEQSDLQLVFSDCASDASRAFFPNSESELQQALRNIAVRSIDLHLIK